MELGMKGVVSAQVTKETTAAAVGSGGLLVFGTPFMIAMMEKDDFHGPVNLGNPQEMTILELAEMIIAKTGSASRIVYRDLPVDDPVKRKPDIELAKRVLGWEPKVPLSEGLDRTIAYFKSRY